MRYVSTAMLEKLPFHREKKIWIFPFLLWVLTKEQCESQGLRSGA